MNEAVASPTNGHVPGAALRLLGDDRLARRAAQGDREAFAVLYRRHHQALYRYCRAILGDGEDAADALQNTMAAALRALPGERREIRVKPWLYRVAHNESVSMLRRRAPHADLDAVEDVAAPPRSDPETKERLRQLVIDMRALQDRQRAALVMRELNGLGYDEIAVTLETSQSATKQLVYEARSALHEMAEGRDMSCDAVRRALSAQDRRMLRGRKLRAHVRECAGCRDFHKTMDVRRRDLAAVAPPLPALAAASLLQGLIGGGSSGGGALAGLASAAAGKVAATSVVTKGVATVAVVATVGAGAAGVTGNLPVAPARERPAVGAPSRPEQIRDPVGSPASPAKPRSRSKGAGTGRGVSGRPVRANRRRAVGQGAHGGPRSRRGNSRPRRTRPGSSRRVASQPRRPNRTRPATPRRAEKTRPSSPAASRPRVPAKPVSQPAKVPEPSDVPAIP